MDRQLVVLESFQPPGPATNPYIWMLADSVAATPGVELATFDWRTALLGRYDVFHVHWPEVVVRGSSPLKTGARQAFFLALLLRLGLTRTPVVRTLHNLAPHDGVGRRESALLAALDRLTTERILLNSAAAPPGPPATVIVHGHYRTWFEPYEVPAPVPGRVASFGLIKPYKGVDRLVTAFRAALAMDPELSLRIAGRPAGPAFAAELRELAGREDRIVLDLAYVDDATLARLIGEAELVVLPYRQMYNSGGVLAALSLDRPVLVPDTPVNRDLSAEVGPGWVHLYRGELGPENITGALDRLRAEPPARAADLSAREWARVGQEHLKVFRRAVETGGGLRRRKVT